MKDQKTKEPTIYVTTCKTCGHETSGPDKKAVQQVAHRHAMKKGHLFVKHD